MELERLCLATQEHTAGLQDGHSGTWTSCAPRVLLLKPSDPREPAPYPHSAVLHHLQRCSSVQEHGALCKGIYSHGPQDSVVIETAILHGRKHPKQVHNLASALCPSSIYPNTGKESSKILISAVQYKHPAAALYSHCHKEISAQLLSL